MIVIVGAGVTGLTVGHELEKRGIPVVVLEANDRVGGVMWTRRADDIPLDVGPQRTRLTTEVRSLVEEVGLGDELLRASESLPVYVYRNGRLRPVPFTLGEAIRTDLLGWGEKLRVLAEPFTDDLRPHETVAEFFVRKFGSGVYRAMIGPMYGGLYASDPARMPARHALATVLSEFGLVEGSLLFRFLRGIGAARGAVPTVSFREGMQALPRALARGLGDRVRLESPARAIRRDGGSGLVVEAAGGEPIEAEAVVLTLPAPAAAGLLEELAPDAAGRLAGLTYNPLAVVHLSSECPLRGFGYQVAFGEEMVTRGVTWNASIFDRDGAYTAYLGGMKNPEVEAWSDEQAAEVARTEFRRVTGCDADVLAVSRIRMPAWDRSWDALDELELPPDVHLCSNYTARPGVPGRIRQARELAGRLEREGCGGR